MKFRLCVQEVNKFVQETLHKLADNSQKSQFEPVSILGIHTTFKKDVLEIFIQIYCREFFLDILSGFKIAWII